MAISNSPVGTFFSCSWLHSRSTAESRSAAHVSISGISGKDSDYWHIVYRLCSLSAVILLRAAKALKRFGEFCVFGLRNRPWQTCACVGSRCSRKHIIVAFFLFLQSVARDVSRRRSVTLCLQRLLSNVGVFQRDSEKQNRVSDDAADSSYHPGRSAPVPRCTQLSIAAQTPHPSRRRNSGSKQAHRVHHPPRAR